MIVRANTSSGDWNFGRSKADYIKDDKAIAQNVKTRILSFKNDWFLDVEAEIDWFTLLGNLDTREQIRREIERVTVATEGVLRINDLQLTKRRRNANVRLSITTIFDTRLTIELGLER